MGKLSTEEIQQMLIDERNQLLIEVKEKAEQRKKLMVGESQVNDYNFFKRRNSITG